MLNLAQLAGIVVIAFASLILGPFIVYEMRKDD